MTLLAPISPGLISEVILLAVVALFMAVAMVCGVWYVLKKLFPDDAKEVDFFLTFIVVIVPFMTLICFGSALIHYHNERISDWPQILPINPFSPLLICSVVFYIGQTVWLWWDWRHFTAKRGGSRRAKLPELSQRKT